MKKNYRYLKIHIYFFFFTMFLIYFFMPVTVFCQEKASETVVHAKETWTGDFDEMVERNMIRVLVVYSKTFYFLDKADQKGISYDIFTEFEKVINQKLQRKTKTVNVVFIPVSRDELLPALVKGRGDIAAANLTITPARQKLVDFSDPMYTNVNEIVVTGPDSPLLANLDDLAGKEIFVRTSSSYYEHLLSLNESFKQAGKTPITLTPADEFLEDEDLLEMVNAGLISMIVVDNHKAEFWAQIFDNITLHPEIAIHTGGQIAWAFRKNSPKLKAEINGFVKDHKKGSLLGNIIFKRYLQNTKWVKNALAGEEYKKFEAMIEFFKKYAEMYGFDHLMVAAQGYQESRLDQSVVSSAGALGVMQLLPSTAADPAVGIPEINILENNIHAGAKYMRYIFERYFKDADMDRLNKGLFSFASYNAGPARIAKLRKDAAEQGLNPNVWFDNVELIAAKEIGRETVQYVSNIYKYYIAYRLIVDQHLKKGVTKLKEAPEQEVGEVSPKALSQETIFKLQQRLTELGYSPGPRDGMWGKKTEAALKKFQEDHGISITGKLDKETQEKLGL